MLKNKKNICAILAIFYLFILAFSSLTATISHAERQYYAKIMGNNVYFYSQPVENTEARLFAIPESYFVLLLGEENGEFYIARYDDVDGYVLKDEVVVMDGTPSKPYASSSFRIFALEGMGLYSSPYINDLNILANVPYLADELVYYGDINGEAIPDKSNIWYYCKYNDIFGYVYSVFCDSLQVDINNEIFNVVDVPIFSGQNSPSGLSPVAMTFIVIGVSLPCLVVIYLLIKPSFAKEKVLNNTHKIPKKKRHGDYYEFDESDLN